MRTRKPQGMNPEYYFEAVHLVSITLKINNF